MRRRPYCRLQAGWQAGCNYAVKPRHIIVQICSVVCRGALTPTLQGPTRLVTSMKTRQRRDILRRAQLLEIGTLILPLSFHLPVGAFSRLPIIMLCRVVVVAWIRLTTNLPTVMTWGKYRWIEVLCTLYSSRRTLFPCISSYLSNKFAFSQIDTEFLLLSY